MLSLNGRRVALSALLVSCLVWINALPAATQQPSTRYAAIDDARLAQSQKEPQNWPIYNGGWYEHRYSFLDQVNLDTVMSAYFAVNRRMNVDQMTMGFSPTVDLEVLPQHPFHPAASSISADEIPFAFDNIKESRLTSTSPDAQALADKVSAAWIAFARSGDPNTSRLPKWAAFNAKDRPTMFFNNESRVENDPLREQRIAMFSALNLA